jgi:hypothetical protein
MDFGYTIYKQSKTEKVDYVLILPKTWRDLGSSRQQSFCFRSIRKEGLKHFNYLWVEVIYWSSLLLKLMIERKHEIKM